MIDTDKRKRNKSGLAFAVAIAFSAIATTTFAAPMDLTDGDRIKLDRTGTYGSTAGGEFRVTSAFVPGDSFLTFCLEYSETISLNTHYYVDVNDRAVKGGAGVLGDYAGDPDGVAGSYDPLSKATAWLYTQFSDNTFGDYGIAFSYTSTAWADSLQKAIWVLEDEKPLSFLDTNATTLRNAAIANSASWTDTRRVRVLNLWDSYNATTGAFSGQHQDQLYITPLDTTTHAIPEPETYAMLLAGLGLMGFVVRRRRKTAV